MMMNIPLNECRNINNDIIDVVEDVLRNYPYYKQIEEDIQSGVFKVNNIKKYHVIEQVIQSVEEIDKYLDKKEVLYIKYKYYQNKPYNYINKKLGISNRTITNWRLRIIYKIARRGAII